MDNIKPIGSNRNDSSQNNDTEGVENAFLKKINNLTVEERRKKNLAENALPHLSIAQQNLLNQLLVLLQQAGLINVSSQSTEQTDYSQSILAALAALAKSLGLPENKSTYQQLLDKISAHSASQQSLANSASNPQSSRPPMTTLSEEVANHLKKNQADESSNPVLSPLSASKLLNATSMSSAQQTLTNNAFAQCSNPVLSPLSASKLLNATSMSSAQQTLTNNAFAQTTLINQLQQAATQNIIANTPNNSLTYRFKKWNKDDAVNISITLATGSVTLEPSTPTVKQRLGEQLAKNTTELPNIRIVGSNANPDEPQEGRN